MHRTPAYNVGDPVPEISGVPGTRHAVASGDLLLLLGVPAQAPADGVQLEHVAEADHGLAPVPLGPRAEVDVLLEEPVAAFHAVAQEGARNDQIRTKKKQFFVTGPQSTQSGHFPVTFKYGRTTLQADDRSGGSCRA